MKFLCLIDSLASGGAERQMSYLVRGLVRVGNKVTLVVFSDKDAFYKEYVSRSGVELIFDGKGFNKYRRILRIVHWARKIKPDAVIAYKDGVTMAACMARIFSSFRLIVSERNTTQTLTRYERLKFWLYRFADHIVPNSFSQKRFIDKHYPDLSDKTTVITNALDTDSFEATGEGSGTDRLVVVTTARVMSQKNVLRYLDAISLLKQRGCRMAFRWYGYQSEPYFSQVKKKTAELDVGDMIEFYPAVKDVMHVYSNSDIFCLPSVYEGFPNVVCEAMSCRLPVVCGNVCDNGDIVEDGVNGFLFDPTDAADIAATLERIALLSADDRRSMGAANREKIVGMCSTEAFIAKYMALI